MKTFEPLSTTELDAVNGGVYLDRQFPFVHFGQRPQQGNFNTGITGGLNVPNNRVPPPDGGFNTGITGGLNIPNNRVPRPAR